MKLLNGRSVHHRLKAKNSPAKTLLQIHDELIFEAAEDTLESLAQIVRHVMQNVLQIRVPLKVDVKSGDNWADCEPWTV